MQFGKKYVFGLWLCTWWVMILAFKHCSWFGRGHLKNQNSSVIVIQSMKHNAPFQLGCFLQGITRIVQVDWTQKTAVNCLFWEMNQKVQGALSALHYGRNVSKAKVDNKMDSVMCCLVSLACELELLWQLNMYFFIILSWFAEVILYIAIHQIVKSTKDILFQNLPIIDSFDLDPKNLIFPAVQTCSGFFAPGSNSLSRNILYLSK